MFPGFFLLAILSGIPPQVADAATAPPDPTYLAELQKRALDLDVHKSRAWRKLLYIVPKWFHSNISMVDGEDFFASPAGQISPRAELLAVLEQFFDPAPSDPEVQHPQCHFAARYLYLHRVLKIDDSRLPPQSCPRYDHWRGNLQTGAVSIVFSSFYMNNPSSGFGHTFLRLHKQSPTPGKEGSALLDWAVNFAATPNTTNTLLYPLRGISGAFPGRFSILPYYAKVSEYNDFESRDLWEYDLGLTPDEVVYLQSAIWEFGDADVSYYYLDDNCSFVLLAMLNILRPELELTDGYNVWITPPDTLRSAVEGFGVADRAQFRMSNLTRTQLRLDAINDAERDCAWVLVANPEKLDSTCLNSFSPPRQAATLDFAVEYIDYKDNPVDQRRSRKYEALRPQILGKRASLRVASPELQFSPQDLRPETGHNDSLIAIAPGYRFDSGPITRFTWRPSLQDRFQSRRGYAEGLEIHIFDTVARLETQPTPRLFFERFDFMAVVSLVPLSSLSYAPSWRVTIGAQEGRQCEDPDHPCKRARIGGGAGFSVRPIGLTTLYLIPGTELAFTNGESERFQMNVDAIGGFLVPLGLRYKAFVDGLATHQVFKRYQTTMARAGFTALPSQNQEYRLVGSINRGVREVEFQAGYFW